MASYAYQLPLGVPVKYTLLFGLGALVMRGAGCTINDLWDRNLDKAVGASGPAIPDHCLNNLISQNEGKTDCCW